MKAINEFVRKRRAVKNGERKKEEAKGKPDKSKAEKTSLSLQLRTSFGKTKSSSSNSRNQTLSPLLREAGGPTPAPARTITIRQQLQTAAVTGELRLDGLQLNQFYLPSASPVKDTVQSLVLDDNRLTELSPCIKDLGLLRKLSAERNFLCHLSPLHCLPSRLEELWLRDNHLESVDSGWERFAELQRVLLSNNPSISFVHPSFAVVVQQTRRHLQLGNGMRSLLALTEHDRSLLRSRICVDMPAALHMTTPESILVSLESYLVFLGEIYDIRRTGVYKYSGWRSGDSAVDKVLRYYVAHEHDKLTKLSLRDSALLSYPPALSICTCLLVLDLSCNRLRSLDASISTMEALTSLDLRENEIELLPTEMYRMSRLETLQCDDTVVLPPREIVRRGADSVRRYLERCQRFCESVEEEIQRQSSEQPSLGSVSQWSLLRQSLTRAKRSAQMESSIDLSCLDLRNIPLHINKMPHLVDEIVLSANEITSLWPDSLMTDAHDKFLYSSSFPLASKWRLDNNRLAIVSSTEGKMLKKAKVVSLTANDIISVPGIVYMANISKLDLSKNKIERLPKGMGDMQFLEYIDVSNNRLKKIAGGLFRTPLLLTVNVDNNNISELPRTIVQATRLRSVSLRSNQLQGIPIDLCLRCPVQSLFVEGNNELCYPLLPLSENNSDIIDFLKATTKAIKSGVLTLRQVDLGAGMPSFIHSLRSWTTTEREQRVSMDLIRNFNSKDGLTRLTLQSCSLSHVPRSLLLLTNLESLNLRNNALSTLPNSSLMLPHLRTLVLAGNMFVSFSDIINALEGEHKESSRTTTVDSAGREKPFTTGSSFPVGITSLYSGHNWMIFCQAPGSQHIPCSLHKLDVSYNKISQLGSTAYCLSSLSELHLHHNRIQEIGESFFERLNSLQVLLLNNNALYCLPTSISRLTNLEKISLNANNFDCFPCQILDLPIVVDRRKKNLDDSICAATSKTISTLKKKNRAEKGRGSLLQKQQSTSKRLDTPRGYSFSFLADNPLRDVPPPKRSSLSATVEYRDKVHRASQTGIVRLTCEGLEEFRLAPVDLNTIVFLDLSQNEIEWINADAILKLRNVAFVLLDNNKLQTLPAAMASLPKLQYISARGNRFVGTLQSVAENQTTPARCELAIRTLLAHEQELGTRCGNAVDLLTIDSVARDDPSAPDDDDGMSGRYIVGYLREVLHASTVEETSKTARPARLRSMENRDLTETPVELLDVDNDCPEWVSLSNNFLTDIPNVIHLYPQLRKLRGLLLRHNRFCAIPSVLQHLPELVCLDMSHNRIDSSSLSTLPSTLQVFAVSGCPLLEIAHHQFASCTDLEYLFVNGCQLHHLDGGFGTLLPRLKVLDARDNKICLIPKSLGGCSELLCLRLANNKLDRLRDNVLKSACLRVLDVERNDIEDIPPEVCELFVVDGMQSVWQWNDGAFKSDPREPTVVQKVLPGNNLQLALSIPELRDAVSLIKENRGLMARWNPLCHLPSGVRSCDRQMMMYFQACQRPEASPMRTCLLFRGCTLLDVPQRVLSMKAATVLDLVRTQIEFVPSGICALKALKVLLLDDNALNSLPFSIAKLRELRYLTAYGNPFEGAFLEFRLAPPSARLALVDILQQVRLFIDSDALPLARRDALYGPHQSRLLKLVTKFHRMRSKGSYFLEGKDLSSGLPEALSSMKNVSELQLIRCGLTNVAELARSFPSLRRLVLSENCIASVSFEVLHVMTRLQHLDLSSNDLCALVSEGESPKANSVKSLKTLNLARNSLQSLMITVKFPGLVSLDLRDNRLEKLDEELGEYLPALEELLLAYNCLRSLPLSIAKLHLRFLDVSYNLLETCPVLASSEETLQDLFLSYNRLTELDETVWRLKSLVRLRCSFNQIAMIPEDIHRLETLKELLLKGNKLSVVPQTLVSLKVLETVEMSRNPIVNVPLVLLGKHWTEVSEYLNGFHDAAASMKVQ